MTECNAVCSMPDTTVIILNSTCYAISNLMWITLQAGASIGVSMMQWAMLREDEGVKELLDQGSIVVSFDN